MTHRSLTSFVVLAVSLLLPLDGGWAQPYSPEESLSKMQVEKGFKVSVFAAEPFIVDPVVMTFDERGGIYVAEMREMEILPALEPGTKATLELVSDTDGDGRVDHATRFAEGLSFPSGLAPYDGGLFALCTPDLLYLKDTDGDGVADVRRVVFTGFGQGNAEHRCNNLTWGIDNWIYGANGYAGGKVTDPGRPDLPAADLSGRDFRFDPASGQFEAISRGVGGGYGCTFDDWGRRYVCQNESHVMHVVIPERYIARNPYLAVDAMGEDISDHGRPDARIFPISTPQSWRVERTQRRAKLESDKFTPTELQPNGYFTAACGVTAYCADLFPESHRGSLFVCDPANNLVHRDVLSEAGASMVASRRDVETEFLRSSESWFRPVDLFSGPDGALYIIDFYREIIETAASIPPDILAKLDLRAGSDKGRIYRVAPDDRDAPCHPVLLDGLRASELVEKLADGNAWVRLTAQRLLLERKASEVVPALKQLALKGENPIGRLHALWTLRGLGALDEPTVAASLNDPHPRIREHSVLLAEALLQP
jgi:putative membrane-bound dehydrogenase-like protein